jgi:hypothetical protein
MNLNRGAPPYSSMAVVKLVKLAVNCNENAEARLISKKRKEKKSLKVRNIVFLCQV